MSDALTSSLLAGHALLRQRICETTYVAFPREARDHQARADVFLISACRHVSAVSQVLAAAVSRSGDPARARQIHRECHRLQLSLKHAKGRLYGSAQLAGVSWKDVWSQVVERFDTLAATERAAVAELTGRLPTGTLEALAEQMSRAELRAPTRPHPYLPRRGMHGRLARALCSRADGIWDSFEGRCPPPASPLVRA